MLKYNFEIRQRARKIIESLKPKKTFKICFDTVFSKKPYIFYIIIFKSNQSLIIRKRQ